MKKTILKKNYYRQPTAMWLRMLGDFFNYAGAVGGVTAVVQEDKWIAIAFILVGSLGKAVTNAFTSINVEEVSNEEN